MTANKMPEMPKIWQRETAMCPNLYDEADVIATRRACYLAGLEAARQAVPTYASPDYASPFSPPYAEGHEDGFGDCRDATLTNLTALEQEAKK